ncbi:MAG: response regulator [Chitinophagaceae bacterium]|nr:response regulator [Rubrivivax sp.]
MQGVGKTVVVVDDDPEMARAVSRLLKAAGFHSITFDSGEALLASGALAPAACLILDVHMPGMSGLELAERLQESGSRLPMIFITANDDPLLRERARRLDALGFLIKPFDSETLLSLIP